MSQLVFSHLMVRPGYAFVSSHRRFFCAAGRATVTGGSPQPRRAGPRRDTFLERIRRAASQPALARPGAPNLSRLADAAIESLSDLPTSEPGYVPHALPIM